MSENELSAIVIEASIEIHRELGPGLLESVYEEILAFELMNTFGLLVQRQKAIPVIWKDRKLEMGFRTDLIVENCLLIEIKSIEALAPVHYKQVLTYLKLTGLKLGLLINFNDELLKKGIRRVVNKL